MTAESVRQVAVSRLQEKIRDGEKKLREQARYRPPSILNGVLLPGNSAEEVGMVTSEVTAELRTLESAIDIINEAYRTITNPTTPEELQEQPAAKTQEKFYG